MAIINSKKKEHSELGTGELPFSKEKQVAKNKDEMVEKKEINNAKHTELIKKVMKWRRRMYGTGRILVSEVNVTRGYQKGTPYPDVIELTKAYENQNPIVYEIKVSRADLMHDIKTKKYEKYFPYCDKFYYVTPQGLINRAGISEKCGLIEYSHTFIFKKHAERLRGILERTSLLSIMFRLDNLLQRK